jgi:hypothetical protein
MYILYFFFVYVYSIMPKSRKFRKNRMDYKIEFELDPMRDVPFTKLEKVLPKPKTMIYYYQKNHGKHREPSIVIFNQKIQGRTKKMGGMTRSNSEKYNKTMKRRVKKTRRNRSNKYKKGMMGGNPPKKPVKGPNLNPVIVQGPGTNLGLVLAQEQTDSQIRQQTGQRNLSDQYSN